jgi:hypothetical protein
MRAKRKQDTANMAEREALEVTRYARRSGRCSISTGRVSNSSTTAARHTYRTACMTLVAARKKLGLAQRNETKALAALRASGG